jgi:nucleotide-binding universal stress UspA family protein
MKSNGNNNKNILIAVDGSDNAKRAVLYVRDLLGGFPGFHITLLTIISQPPDDYFVHESERTDWIEKHQAAAGLFLGEYRQTLLQAGFRDEDIASHTVMKECTSLAECILDEQRRLGCGTVVIGRRGISRKEEFIFGSTSNKILHTSKECAVWVID